MDPHQLQLFKKITLDYFAKLSPGDEPVLETPYLQFGEPALLDYASLVRIRGEYEGCLVLTSPVTLLHSLLDVHGEAEVSERTLLDMCRELTNVLSGNASQAFSGAWEISVPMSLGPGDFQAVRLPPSAFVMPIRWRGSTALLVVGLEPAGGNGG
ncbi:MAG TPA: chemotaxis protein CheX [Thermoanaerobaculia bacterium]|jgi:hypothetical protein|nr:chemotaxis protein CheX [Thermoanaerobaculia bacterium]